MPTSEKWFTPATKVAKSTEAIDNLPPTEMEEWIKTGEYEEFAEFQAYVRGSKISPTGELMLTIGVPYEFKYEAMALTDLRGTVFILRAYRPRRPGERTNTDTSTNTQSNGHDPFEPTIDGSGD